jgi:catechol 2,3-dioxygenase-like lactoylglutathione lyase family enzyme
MPTSGQDTDRSSERGTSLAAVDTPAASPLAAPRLTHVALPCADLDRTIAFYTSVTPLVVVARREDDHGRSAWLSNEGQVVDPFVVVLAEVERGPGPAVPTLTPFAHIGIEVPARADIDATAERGRRLGCLHWEPRQMPEHIGYICALEDPDGNIVEFSYGQKVFATVRALWGGDA